MKKVLAEVVVVVASEVEQQEVEVIDPKLLIMIENHITRERVINQREKRQSRMKTVKEEAMEDKDRKSMRILTIISTTTLQDQNTSV